MSDEQRAGLRALTSAVHARARRLRFWETPHSEELWRELRDAGVDAIGADDLPRLRRFWTGGVAMLGRR